MRDGSPEGCWRWALPCRRRPTGRPIWRAQLRWDHVCDAQLVSNVIERLVDGRQMVIAKAHCDDGRVFDAIQRDEFTDFEITECTPVEQAC